MRLILKTDCCTADPVPDRPCGRPVVFILPVLLPPDGGLGYYGPVGRGAVLHQLPGGRHCLSGNCVPAFPLRLAGGGGRCHYGAEHLKPVSAAIHHKLTASGQLGPKRHRRQPGGAVVSYEGRDFFWQRPPYCNATLTRGKA